MADAEPLWVFHGERRVGRIDVGSTGRMAFTYDHEWVTSADAFAISVSLPLDEEQQGLTAHRFFVNLLPEGQAREQLARRLGLSVDNDVELLRAVGGECAGALSIVPLDEPPSRSTWDYRRLTEDELSQLAHRGAPLPDGVLDGARLSLAGAQDKLPVWLEHDAVFLPLGGAPSSHILKFPNPTYSHLPDNETLMTLLAARCELPVVDVRRVEYAGTPMALVRRYDRPLLDGRPTRTHQEDLCQAQGIAANRKYEADGGATFAQVYELVRAQVTSPLTDCATLLRWLAFCYLAGNSDGHGKNLSLVYAARSMRLAPIYDLVCTRAYPRVERRLAFAIGGERDPGQIGHRHWNHLAETLDIGGRYVRGIVRTMTDKVENELDAAVGEFKDRYGTRPILQMAPTVIRRQVRRARTMMR